jgi:hypothetical protein
MDERTIEERIAQMQAELDALRGIKTAEDVEEGERLHRKHNAPWVKGPYSHLEFPPYKYQEFPRMLYGLDYFDALKALAEAEDTPAYGPESKAKDDAIKRARVRLSTAMPIVRSEQQLRSMGPGWFLSGEEVAAELKRQQTAVETAAAHRAYEDRNMSEKAKREIDKFDEAADHFVAEIPQARRGPKGRRVKA